MEKRLMITIYLIYAIPTVLFTIYNFNISLLGIIITKCLADCLILPMLTYYILKIFSLLKYLEFYVSTKVNKDKLEIYMHLYVIIIVSTLIAIAKLIYVIYVIINPLKVAYLQQLAIFQLKIYILLTVASFYMLHIFNRSN